MRVVHVIAGLDKGGAETTLYRLLEKQDAQIESSVVSLLPGGFYREKIEDLGIAVYDLGIERRLPLPTALLRLRKFFLQLDADVIHAWMYHAALASLIVRPKAPVLIGVRHSLHDLEAETRLTKLVVKGLSRLSRRADRVIYCAYRSKLQHEEIGYSDKRAIVIPNGFDCEALCPMPSVRQQYRAMLGFDQDDFVVGHVGRNHETKDHTNLLEGFSRQCRAGSGRLRLVMAGAGVSGLSSRVAELGVQQYVTLFDQRDDIPKLLSSFDVLVNSSRSESFPNILGEAMACGIPCIATDVGDSALIVGETGIIVPARDPEALSDALGRMAVLSLEERGRMGRAARQRIIDNFSLLATVASYGGLYRSTAASMRRERI